MSADVPRSALFLGGARSGKTRAALDLAERSSPTRIYVATALALDDEMRAKVAAHRAERGEGWRTVEAPLDLAEAIARECAADRATTVDCLTLWLANVIGAGRDAQEAVRALADAVRGARGPLAIVTNEIGQGIVPADSATRFFRDAHGAMNRAVAAACDRVILVTAGIEMIVKPAPHALSPLR
ncbi:MAG: bifunctional adenosylcobinamide kinase/adenosylcobinamide-phosphate guanylyltransferase [Hyphomicrobiales bacterium]|nr:bifunctional adenosylcobinamide kinase/adenosylcobinamide-phosphate guanylyltransferase [Hyphomicrobiales bacterium]